MENKYQVGSVICNIKNCRDVDYVIISNECDYKVLSTNGETILHRSEDHLKKYLTFKTDDYKLLIYNYQYDSNIIKQNFPIKYNILDYRKQLVTLLKRIVAERLFKFNQYNRYKKEYCASKLLYHVAYNLFICLNNSTTLSKDQQEVIQKLHDKCMPISYIDEMTKIINNLDEIGGDTNGA